MKGKDGIDDRANRVKKLIEEYMGETLTMDGEVVKKKRKRGRRRKSSIEAEKSRLRQQRLQIRLLKQKNEEECSEQQQQKEEGEGVDDPNEAQNHSDNEENNTQLVNNRKML